MIALASNSREVHESFKQNMALLIEEHNNRLDYSFEYGRKR